MDNIPENTLLAEALAAAQAQGLDIAPVRLERKAADLGADARLRLRFGGQKVQFLAEVKRHLRPAMLGAVLLQLKQLGEEALLVTDHVTPPLAEELRARGVAFLDAAGNAYLNRPPVLVWIKGQRPAARPVAPHAGRAFRATGLQVVFALLCLPELVARPYREIAQQAGVAHGTVGIVMANLADEGFIIELKQGGRRLHNARRLLDAWVEAYARTLRPKLLLGTFRAQAGDWWRQVDAPAYQARLGAEPAAARLDNYLRPGIATFYAEKLPARLLADHRLRADPYGDVEIRKRFWNFDLPDYPELTPPVLVYADLLATGDGRCMEAAQLVYERHLAGLFEQA